MTSPPRSATPPAAQAATRVSSAAQPVPLERGEPILLVDVADGVTTLTLNRPTRLNALSGEMLATLQAALDAIDADTRVVVLAARGRAFCAGHDLAEMREHADESRHAALFARCSRVMESFLALPQPVIAKVQGLATAAGCQLVANADLAIADEEARFAVSGIDVGLFCSTPSVPLSRNMGRKRAFEMLMTGNFVSAATAVDWGLLNRAVPAADLDATVDALAASIAAKSAVAVATGKRLFYDQLEQPLTEAYRQAGAAMARNMMSADAAEGIDAFREKREPRWQHR